MNKQEALTIMIRLKPTLVEKYGVVRLALFGSTVRNEAHDKSDIDVVVSFDGPSTSHQFFGVQFLLEDTFGLSVDLVTEKAIRPELKPYIEREAIDV